MKSRSVFILCSGGLDSVTALYSLKKTNKYKKIKVCFFNYKQRNLASEKKAVKYFVKKLFLELFEIKLPWFNRFSKSSLHKNRKVKNKSSLNDTKKESEQWYVPARNLVFLSIALALAEGKSNKNEIWDIVVGFKDDGKETFLDASHPFIKKINDLSKIATNNKIRIHAPLINKDKEDIIKLAKQLNVPLEKTYSCYVGGKKHCGKCLACRLRKAGFYWANEKDLTEYSNS